MNSKAPPVYDVSETSGGFAIRRDGKTIRTPAGKDLILPAKALAEAVAEERRAQPEKPKPETMPLIQLATTALDIVAGDREQIAASVAACAESDLLCHRADQPPELTRRQQELWQPWLDWAARKYGAVLYICEGIMPVKQPDKSLVALREAVVDYDLFHLTGLRQVVSVSGSLVLGLALAEKKITAQQLFEAAELDTLFQIEKWGEDPVTAARLESAQKEFELCERWFLMMSEK